MLSTRLPKPPFAVNIPLGSDSDAVIYKYATASRLDGSLRLNRLHHVLIRSDLAIHSRKSTETAGIPCAVELAQLVRGFRACQKP